MFKKGQSGNPNGRAIETTKQKKTAALLLSPLVDKAVMQVKKQLESDDPDSQRWAVNLIMSYVFGKPKQEVDMTSAGEKIGILYVGTPKADTVDITPEPNE